MRRHLERSRRVSISPGSAWLLAVALGFLVGCEDGLVSGNGAEEGAPVPTDDVEPRPEELCDIQEVFRRYNCTSCHDDTPEFNGAGLDLASDGLAQRLIDRPSVNPSCANEVVVDLATPEASLLLRSVAPSRYAGSGDASCDFPVMPLVGSERLTDLEVDCLENWIGGLEPDSVPDDPAVVGDAFTVLSKTKYVMHGGAITADELAKVSDESGRIRNDALREVVATWMATPEFQVKRRQFLRLALQQDPADTNYFLQFRNTNGRSTAPLR
ncbi:MAG: hypothetical protein AAFQ82_19105, partial [Myxococcota bacterium]